MAVKKKLYVCLSLDVEEEGLFGGHYEAEKPALANIALLPELEPLLREFSLPPTLFCAWSVFADRASRKCLERLRVNCGAEIAAHLHHWNTPPRAPARPGPPERTHLLPRDLLLARLDTLLNAGSSFLGAPVTSFRMGRWDLKSFLFPFLAERGIKVDSSICPLRAFPGGADHFLAPASPWWQPTESGTLLEAPVTQLPLLPVLSKLWYGATGNLPGLRDAFHFFGALSPNPFWHNAFVMRQAVRLHVARGGKVLNLFWHSSETMPGGSPQTPDRKAARRHWAKIFSFFGWLADNYEVRGLTLGQLPEMEDIFHFPVLQHVHKGDF